MRKKVLKQKKNFLLQKSVQYDVLIVGGGHAGCEAALACARLGFCTLLITSSIERIAVLSCNPAIGGVGKGHLVKEIDALGGQMAKVADATGIHFKTLNASKGAAVRATRCQIDMELYRQTMLDILLSTEGLFLRQDDVIGIISDGSRRVAGVKTRYGGDICGKKIILTVGTFMNACLHLGDKITPGGRFSESSSSGLSCSLKNLGFKLGRLKTGTCPRLDARTIDFGLCQEQIPDLSRPCFSFRESSFQLKQISCWLTHTTKKTHDIIQDAIGKGLAPVYNGQIRSKGPRYCLSIEDKINYFGSRDSHHIFLEPQGLKTHEIYPNGITSSLPAKVQLDFLRSIPGLLNVEVTRWGYAVEYDFIDPTQCYMSLETKKINGLYLAGQINGTTGYEEAAVQGLLAGLNAVRSLIDKKPIILGRHQSYIGVLISDLTIKGTTEPYRMFTSRAEHRLILREDNVYERLSRIGFESGLLEKNRFNDMNDFEEDVQKKIFWLKNTNVKPSDEVLKMLRSINSSSITKPTRLSLLLKRPEISVKELITLCLAANLDVDKAPQKWYRAAVEIKYEGYIKRSRKSIKREQIMEHIHIPAAIFTTQFPGLSNEIFEKLKTIRPQTLYQASLISGVTPAALSIISIEIKKLYKNA